MLLEHEHVEGREHGRARERGRDKEALGRRVTGKSGGRNGPAFLFVELVTHRLAQSLELPL
jgi:hypothetical protein